MNNAVYSKTTENLRNRIDVRLISKKKKLFKMDIKWKSSYTLRKILDNDLVAMHS